MKEYRKPLWKDYIFLLCLYMYSLPLFFTDAKTWWYGDLFAWGLGTFILLARSYTYRYICLDEDTLYIRHYFYPHLNTSFPLADIEHIDFERPQGTNAEIWIQILTPITWSKRYTIGLVSNKQLRRLIKTLKKLDIPMNTEKIAAYIKK